MRPSWSFSPERHLPETGHVGKHLFPVHHRNSRHGVENELLRREFSRRGTSMADTSSTRPGIGQFRCSHFDALTRGVTI